jgi:hypothetical protein
MVERFGSWRSEMGGGSFDGVAGGREEASSRGHVTASLVMGVR